MTGKFCAGMQWRLPDRRGADKEAIHDLFGRLSPAPTAACRSWRASSALYHCGQYQSVSRVEREPYVKPQLTATPVRMPSSRLSIGSYPSSRRA